MERVKARFECREVTHHASGDETVLARPVYHGGDENHPNRKFWEASPDGSFEIRITEQGAQGFFEPGVEYDLLISERGQDE